MSLFVTATGSDVGKTIVCALLAHRYARITPQGARPIVYWKPVATGMVAPLRADARRSPIASEAFAQPMHDAQAAPSDSARYAAYTGAKGYVLPEAYSFAAAVSPHWAGRQAHQPVRLQVLHTAYQTHQRAHKALLVEGIGGALVPLNDQGETMADWLGTMKMACVVVAHTGLGTLNHTLLTLEALRQRHIQVAGVVLCGPAHPDNRRSIAAFGHVPVIDSVPWMTPLNADAIKRVARQFDSEGVLAAHLGCS